MVKGREGERARLYVRGTILGYKRSKSNQYPNTSLVQIEGVNTKEEEQWYAGKRAYIYKAKVKTKGSHYRCIWGKVIRPHGNSGVVRAKFTSNLPPKSMSRIIIAKNLPEDHSYQNLIRVFSVVGSVKTIRTCQPQPSNGGGGGASASFKSGKAENMLYSNKLFIFHGVVAINFLII